MKKILIVDDDQTFQKTLSDKLTLLNYEAVTALDGKDGLEKAISGKPDLILLDLKMPKMDGVTLLKALRAKADLPQIPVLITSNSSSMENIADGVALGVRGYIIKSNESLDTIIENVEATVNPQK